MAVDTYEQAMKHSSGNPKLSCRLGHVLVCTHQYGKAIKCYRDAGKSLLCCITKIKMFIEKFVIFFSVQILLYKTKSLSSRTQTIQPFTIY